MKKVFSKEVIIAVVTLVSLFILYTGVNYLKGINIFKPSNHYYVKINNVNELQISSPVYVNGFKVGLVNAIEYDFQNGEDILVLISLDKKMKIEAGSYAELKSGLTSGAYLNLILNKYVSSYAQPGDTLLGKADPGLMDKLAAEMIPQVEAILPRLDSILVGIQTLVTHPALSQSLDHISATTASLEKSSKQLTYLLNKDVPQIIGNVDQITSDFAIVSSNLKTVDINSSLAKVDNAILNLDAFITKLNNKDSSLGLLMNDKSLYNHLDSTAINASELLYDLRKNPKRYVHFSIF